MIYGSLNAIKCFAVLLQNHKSYLEEQITGPSLTSLMLSLLSSNTFICSYISCKHLQAVLYLVPLLDFLIENYKLKLKLHF